METEFNWWIAIAVFFTFVVNNYFYTLHYFLGAKIQEDSELRDLIKDFLHSVLTFGISYGVATYTNALINSWYFVSTLLGIIAAYMVVKYFPIKLSNNGN
jgi:hypothetical protein